MLESIGYIYYYIKTHYRPIIRTVFEITLIIALLIFMVGVIQYNNTIRTKTIEGHEYIVYPNRNGGQIEHSPECEKCKDEQPTTNE